MAVTVVFALAAACIAVITTPVYGAAAGNAAGPSKSAETTVRGTDSSGAEKKTKASGAGKKAGAAEKGIEKNSEGKDNKAETVPFSMAVETFYSNSDSMTDQDIIDSARRIRSDGDVLYSELHQEDKCQDVMNVLDAYEAAKVNYIASQINGEMFSEEIKQEKETEAVAAAGLEMSAKDGICREWDRQSDYTRLMITEDAVISEMIPRYQITSCSLKDGVLDLGVDEWMTQGYGASDAKDVVNASSYIYNFSISLKQNAAGVWTPFAINGTDVNFEWLSDKGDPEAESQEAPENLFEVKSDVSPGVTAYARISSAGSAETASIVSFGNEGEGPDRTVENRLSFTVVGSAAPFAPYDPEKEGDFEQDVQFCGTSGLRTNYYSGYNADKAIAYANKYWKHYNHRYTEYRGLDCANFVSQCLNAGGMPQEDGWFPNSLSWINVPAHIRHFKEYGAFLTASNSNVRRGNPVYYDWHGDGVYDHTTLCVGTNSSGMPVVDGHTTNVFHVPWRMGSGGRRGTIYLNKHASSSSSGSRNRWKTVNGKVYYYDGSGKKVKNRFLKVDGSMYYFDKNGVRKTGFFKVNGNYYYASVQNGRLLTGWQKIGGKKYYFSVKNYIRFQGGKFWIAGGTYCFNNSGVLQKGFIRIGRFWYYADKTTGRFVTGWKRISGRWYYFDPKTKVKAIGWKTIDGRKCFFDIKGILRKGRHG